MVNAHRELREILILLALYTIPVRSVDLISGLALRNGTFLLLLWYIIDLRDRRRELTPPLPGSTLRSKLGAVVPGAVLIALGLYGLSELVTIAFPTSDSGASVLITFLQDAIERHGLWVVVAYMIPTMVVIGYAEELFFRAYLLGQLRTLGVSSNIAICVAAVLFALGHIHQGSGAFIFAGISAVLLGALWYRIPRIDVFAVGHSLYNLVALSGLLRGILSS